MMHARSALAALGLTIVASAYIPVEAQPPADEFLTGCVGCHIKVDGVDHRLPAMLDEIGHVKLGSKVKTVPSDCLKCHSGEEDPTFAELMHLAHFGEAESEFQQKFNGDCRHCHAMDRETGDARLKEGPKNW
jgi:hypothetical protein